MRCVWPVSLWSKLRRTICRIECVCVWMRTISSWRTVRKDPAAASCISAPATCSTSCEGTEKKIWRWSLVWSPWLIARRRCGWYHMSGSCSDCQGREEWNIVVFVLPWLLAPLFWRSPLGSDAPGLAGSRSHWLAGRPAQSWSQHGTTAHKQHSTYMYMYCLTHKRGRQTYNHGFI